MPRQHRHGPLPRGADIKRPDQAVYARGCEDGGAVFVPVVGEGFRGGGRPGRGGGGELCLGGVDRDGEGEVVGGGGGGAEVEEAEVGV